MRPIRHRLMAVAALAVLPATIALSSRPSEHPDAALITTWNATAYGIVFAEDSFRTFKGHRALAMMHVAMHDAINAVAPRYRQYAFRGRDSLADERVAAAQAAHDVLRAAYPNADVLLKAALERTLRASTNRTAATRGIALGRKAAAAIIEARRGDAFDAKGTYAFRTGAGIYQTTPPWNGFVAHPGFARAKPFALSAPSQFRPAPPPRPGSPEFARALEEVKAFGGVRSAARTPDQTAYAIWWMEFAEGAINRLARRMAEERGLSLAESARLFALLNVALFDNYVAVWDSKYEHNHWRPYTAIREADSTWEPLRPTPPFPEYVSAHAAACAASFEILAGIFGEIAFAMETLTAPEGMASRRFPSFRDAAAECADSRVRLGWHFRYATDAGLVLGRSVARHVVEHHLTGR